MITLFSPIHRPTSPSNLKNMYVSDLMFSYLPVVSNAKNSHYLRRVHSKIYFIALIYN